MFFVDVDPGNVAHVFRNEFEGFCKGFKGFPAARRARNSMI